VFSGDVETIELPSVLVAGVAKRTVDEFCRTADRSIGRRHVPFQRGLDAPNKYDNNRALADMVVPLAEQMWRDLYSIDGRHRFEHNHYLKIWQLEGPRIQADYILFDESQDANSLMLAIVEAQDHAQKIWVGDSNQSIYEWNGAVDALKSVEVSNRAVLSQSFRFGPEIAAAANLVLDRLGAGVQITGSGKPGRVGFVDAPDVLLGRTNAEVVARALLEMAGGRRVCLQGGAKEIIWFAESAMMLMGGGRASHPDLACFGSWDAVLRYVQEDENGADLATLVRIVEQFGAQGIIEGLSASVSAANADVTVSTAHKAKGAEWGSVTLLGDFPDQDPGPAELRLMYVAATRAKNELDATLVDLHGPAVERATDSGL
jgi:superfamily I DNA/RNA helicase